MNTKEISIRELERYILGELPKHRIEHIEQIAGEDAKIRKQIDELIESDTKTLEQNPPETMVPGIMDKVESIREKKASEHRSMLFVGKRVFYIMPAAATVVILFFVVLHLNRQTSEVISGGSQYKGSENIEFSGPRIVIVKKTDGGVEELKGGETIKSGDLIQIAYIPEGMRYGVIFSIDGRGIITLHFPEGIEASASLAKENRKLLGSAFELDDAPDFERFFFITSKKEVDVPEILKQARELAASGEKGKTGDLILPDSTRQFSLLLYKGERQ